MNNHMWENAATQANVELLRARGVTVLEPAVGRLASAGEWGAGRLAEPADLLAAFEAALAAGPKAPGAWAGLHVLVSAGGTREPIDSVRFVGNRSSGRMGFALADAAAARGATVTVVAANVALPRNASVSYVDVQTAAELERACVAAFDSADVLLMAAAVADFRPATPMQEKIAKRDHGELELVLEPTTDVLAALGARRRPGQTLVGFAAEHGPDAEQRARAKLVEKDLDAVVLNDISRADIGFDADDNEVSVVTRAGEQHLARAAKSLIADAILDAVEQLRAQQPAALG
jgi:phosphopantothenoylcysteine decarboxylase/phosphopantothenate--cysteine ligase